MKNRSRQSRREAEHYLEGQLLLAMPTMSDKRFRRAVIYLCRHSDAGAMGLIVNQHAEDLTFSELLKQLDLVGKEPDETVPPQLLSKSVHIGGPVSSERGFVLHSSDFVIEDATLEGGNGICVTATVDMLKAIAKGSGPARCLLALGYSGWSAGQLEREIQANGWLHCPADLDLIFADDVELTYERALSTIGVDPTFLVGEAGHA